jgi:crotonobetainyl-CoA:carnitine CoA-transferase CaiB-like acyl-CoA transferase
VLDYSQFVAGPFATMLLADLGADVIKVESPSGDAYRHYEPLGRGESRRFYALNRNKRSIICDLKSTSGRKLSRALLATADAVVHNMPPQRAAAFGLDPESVREANPLAVVVAVSAFGSDGPYAGRIGYDLIAQAYSGLLMTDARLEDTVPRRSGGIPFSDITAGLLACISVTSGLTAREHRHGHHFEVSLLGAALATQIQTFVRTGTDDVPISFETQMVTGSDLKEVAATIADADELEPYYRCYEGSDGFFAVACLTRIQRQRVLAVLELSDQWADNPQAVPASTGERTARADLARRFAERFKEHPVTFWIARLSEAGVPAAEVKLVQQLFDDEQVRANGLVRQVMQRQGGPVELLGSVFKIDGVTEQLPTPAPGLGEHTDELVAELAIATVGGANSGPESVGPDTQPGEPRAI